MEPKITLFTLTDIRKRFLLAVLSGLLLTGSFPKFGSFWVAWVAMVPLLLAIRGLPAGQRFRLGLAAGIVHYLTLTYWLITTMQTYGGLPWYASVGFLILLAAYLSLYVGSFSLLLGQLAPTPLRCLVTAPALWVFLELIRTKALTGFPWELLGYSQYRALQIVQISDIFGVYGVSFLVAAVNTGLFLVWLSVTNREWQGRPVPRKTGVTAGLCAILLPGMALGYGHLRMEGLRRDAAGATHVRAAVIQGNIPQDVKWDPEFKIATTDTYLRLSRETLPDSPDLIVWPETATPFYYQRVVELTRRIEEGIKAAGVSFIIGSPAVDEDSNGYRYYNSAYLITPEGKVSDRYDKQHLVPFGEYVPWQKLLWFVKKMVPGLIDFSTGSSGKVIPWEHGGVGIQICYEMIFPSLSRRAVQNDAALLVNITNDAWFGTSSAPWQHLSMVAMRAVENRRSVVRAANTGISGFVDPTGRIIDRTGLFEEAALVADVPVLAQKTIYTRWGDWFPAVCGIWIAVCIFFRIKTTRPKETTAEKETTHVV